MNGVKQKIISYLKENPGIRSSDIQNVFNEYQRTYIASSISGLSKLGLITKGKDNLYYATGTQPEGVVAKKSLPFGIVSSKTYYISDVVVPAKVYKEMKRIHPHLCKEEPESPVIMVLDPATRKKIALRLTEEQYRFLTEQKL